MTDIWFYLAKLGNNFNTKVYISKKVNKFPIFSLDPQIGFFIGHRKNQVNMKLLF